MGECRLGNIIFFHKLTTNSLTFSFILCIGSDSVGGVAPHSLILLASKTFVFLALGWLPVDSVGSGVAPH